MSASTPTTRSSSRRTSSWAAGGAPGSSRRWSANSPSPKPARTTRTTEAIGLCRRARSGADVRRQVLAGNGGAGGDEVGGRALEDDPAAVVAGAGAEVDDPVGVRHDRLVVLDDED